MRNQQPDNSASLCARAQARPDLLSIVCPAYNEQETIVAFHKAVAKVMRRLAQPYEIVFVNDGSADNTLRLMHELRAAHPNTTIIDLSRNFGKEIAVTAGLDNAQGDAAVVMDADLQHPPQVIDEMIQGWREGYDVVFGVRRDRKDESWLRRSTATLFYRMMNSVGDVPIPLNAGDFRLLDRKAIDAVTKLREHHRFMKGVFAWVGFNTKSVPFDVEPRHAGKTKWNYWRLWNFSIEGFTAHTLAPLKVSTYLGIVVAILSFVYGFIVIGKAILFGDVAPGFPTLAALILFLGGVQLIVLGVIGEYLGRIFNETKNRPLYFANDAMVRNIIRLRALAGGHGGRFVLFGLVGAFNTLTDFLAYVVLISLGVAPALANIGAFAFANPLSYFCNAAVTFRRNGASAGLPPDQPGFWLTVFLFIAVVYFVVHGRRVSRKNVRLRADLEEARVSLATAKTRLSEAEPVRHELESERNLRLELQAQSAVKDAQLAEREKALGEMKQRLDTEFKAATSEMLKGAHEAFLQRANETFARYRETASAEGERRRKALDDLLKPVSDTLARYEKGLAELRDEQQKSRGELKGQIGALARSTVEVREEAQKLATALRAGPKTRGRWGEEQLRNVVEIAGMTAYVDFEEQASHDDGERRKQPDMVVRLPGGRVVAVDSKVSLGAYLDAVEAEKDEERAAHLSRHADDLWNHVKALSAKEYASSLRDALDYVVMFVPGENYFSAAMEARPQLYQDAFDRKILIATPTILIAMLKSAALNWRQEKMTEHAQAVASMAKDLHDSLRVMSGNLTGLGKSLKSALKNYNATIGGYESRVMSRARKFADYEIPGR
ncbi:Uncharacterized glycosyltransferase sll0501 [Durusdinium trenchii]|uniref:Uncharacterized glycosyltransferase sll0501 n=1 Tax=Durusdinium trenchii TaxID=1381693 RepID=A0ABP0LUT7_9DINO